MTEPVFQTRLATIRTPATLVLIALNVAIYAAFAAMGHGLVNADAKALIGWGSNFGPYTTEGQWWRLASAAFLHGGLLHLAVNMFTLYDIGRLCERLYGTRRYLVIYALSGLLGSAASVWWNPMVNSVGASGALFGVLGASFVFMLDKRNGVPPGVMGSHAAAMAVFILYGLINGFARSGIDNAAHLGGLVAGLIAGFALAVPFASGARAAPARAGTGVAICVAAIVGLAILTPNSGAAFKAESGFSAELTRLAEDEKALVGRAREVLGKVQKSSIGQADAGREMAAIASQWGAMRARLADYPLAADSRSQPIRQDLVEYAGLRQQAMARLERAFSSTADDPAAAADFMALMKQGDAVAARMDARLKELKKK